MLQIEMTPERQTQISAYLKKWQTVLSTPIDRDKAIATLTNLYQRAGYAAPKVVFVDSPAAVIASKQLETQVGIALQKDLSSLDELLLNQLTSQLHVYRGSPDGHPHLFYGPYCAYFVEYFSHRLVSKWEVENRWKDYFDPDGDGGLYCAGAFDDGVERTPLGNLEFTVSSCLSLSKLVAVNHAAMYDCAASWGVQFDPEALRTFLNTAMYLDYVFPGQGTCFVSDRPLLKVDDQVKLHALGEPCIVFPNGFAKGYYYHGIQLPEYMGSQHPRQWQAEWVLQEQNAELRRILIGEIGYARLCQELQAEELDSWREYTLLRLPVYDDFATSWQERVETTKATDAMYLLKMTCPSTSFIHVLRVPPSMRQAREAATWVNWDIDPESFIHET